MFSWFYGVWKLENIFQRENILLDTGKMASIWGKCLSDFISVRHFPFPLHLGKLFFFFRSSTLSFLFLPFFNFSHLFLHPGNHLLPGTDISRLISLVSTSKASLALENQKTGFKK
ncbi:uncharacterized protein [Gossypium hirsutum]|uniref:Uncharacterized protein isoform X1 n=1 Tax=Gossypium hirsutum TaxID=3635 RepID=A0ABM2YMP8_GOSHI|nr:uncharacterized protein LOC107951931 isoform X1 [Gossypium hirsutum]